MLSLVVNIRERCGETLVGRTSIFHRSVSREISSSSASSADTDLVGRHIARSHAHTPARPRHRHYDNNNIMFITTIRQYYILLLFNTAPGPAYAHHKHTRGSCTICLKYRRSDRPETTISNHDLYVTRAVSTAACDFAGQTNIIFVYCNIM